MLNKIMSMNNTKQNLKTNHITLCCCTNQQTDVVLSNCLGMYSTFADVYVKIPVMHYGVLSHSYGVVTLGEGTMHICTHMSMK